MFSGNTERFHNFYINFYINYIIARKALYFLSFCIPVITGLSEGASLGLEPCGFQSYQKNTSLHQGFWKH